ncbi:cytochrome b [Sulfurirhabdus autotrophica]|uniref:Cytochrome b561 n=1 Tax=Sulfurirhabdus autotrophica TaxID=1706046 RepID=A0A4R3YB63_9PROT|nr:cytochrome b [Sulfurirhabdus autotrophica]TCV89012.1 cytochrome b561 [Sulfurirhabdus autotrophica]
MKHSTSYTKTAITIHWLVAFLIIGTFPIGMIMSDLPFSPFKLQLISYHKWLGVTIFLLAIARLSWRVTHTPPPLPSTMPTWQKHAANSLHHLIYILLFLIPITGWLMSSAKGFQTVYLGVFPLPDLIGKDKALGNLLEEVHQTLNFFFLGVIIVHVGAALKHYFIDRDNILGRMIPFLNKEQGK